MPYKWTLQAEDLESHSWCELRPFRRAVRGLITKNITVQTDCDAILKIIDDLHNKYTPFSSIVRFPENKIYVDLSHRVNADNLRLTIMAACTFKGLQNIKTLSRLNGYRGNSAPMSLVEDNMYYKKMNDAIVSYSHAVHDLFMPQPGLNNTSNQLTVGIYTRTSFEERSGLVWS